MHHEKLYLKYTFGSSIEFPNVAGVFKLDIFPDLTVFIVLSEEPRAAQRNFASTPNASTITRPSVNLSSCTLTCVKIVWAELDNNEKHSNLRLYNRTVCVNIYSEDQAYI